MPWENGVMNQSRPTACLIRWSFAKPEAGCLAISTELPGMRQADGLRSSSDGFPRALPWAGMNDAFGVRRCEKIGGMRKNVKCNR